MYIAYLLLGCLLSATVSNVPDPTGFTEYV